MDTEDLRSIKFIVNRSDARITDFESGLKTTMSTKTLKSRLEDELIFKLSKRNLLNKGMDYNDISEDCHLIKDILRILPKEREIIINREFASKLMLQ